MLALAKTYYVTSPLGMSDANKIRIPITGGVSYVPIPVGAGDKMIPWLHNAPSVSSRFAVPGRRAN